MKEYFAKKHYHTSSCFRQKRYWLLLLTAAAIFAGCGKGVNPTPLQTSPTGKLSRYDLTSNDYDVLPVTTFTVSYNSNNQMIDLFEKAGQTLFSYNLTYSGGKLARTVGSDLSVQNITYNTDARPSRVDYTTITDTGKLVFSYGTDGKLMALLDSVKKPDNLPIRYQYLYTYDAAGNNVIKITKNELDLQGRPTLKQYSYYTFDSHVNPFTAFPYLQSSSNLPGEFPALVNKNNITSTQLVGTIINTSSGSSVPTLDTITIYRASRAYQYNAKGYPLKATEKFNDIQFNYSGNRTFTYEY
jgi:hypothetical protein